MLSLRGSKIIWFVAYLLFVGCSSESKFTKIGSSASDQDKSSTESIPQNSDSQSTNSDLEMEDDALDGSLDWLAKIELPDDDPQGLEPEIESPIMITGAHIVSCTTIDGVISCVAETDDGFVNTSTIEVFDLNGEPVPKDRIKVTTLEEDGMTKVMITVTPIEEPAPSEQEICEMKEGFIWDPQIATCFEKVLTEEEACLIKDGFYWSATDSLCVEDGTVFGLSVSTVKVNTNLPLGSEPIDIEFILEQTSYIRFVDVYTDWFSKRPTDIKVYHLVNGVKGALIAEKNFPTRDEQICGEDFQSPCTFPDAPVARLTLELDKLYKLNEVIVETGGLLDQSQGFAIIMDVGLRN